MATNTSKFEYYIGEIERQFRGPFPLDRQVLSCLVQRRPGIYIWFVTMNGRKLAYVGQSRSLLVRLSQWARELPVAEVFFTYVPKGSLDSIERRWILKAGDLNKR